MKVFRLTLTHFCNTEHKCPWVACLQYNVQNIIIHFLQEILMQEIENKTFSSIININSIRVFVCINCEMVMGSQADVREEAHMFLTPIHKHQGHIDIKPSGHMFTSQQVGHKAGQLI